MGWYSVSMTMTNITNILLVLLVASLAPAQAQIQGQPSGIPLTQIAPPNTGTPTVFAALGGRLVPVELGAGISMSIVNGKPMLTFAAPAPPAPLVPLRLYSVAVTSRTFVAGRTTVTVPVTANTDTVVFWLNGLRLYPGIDYTTPAPGQFQFQFIGAYGDFSKPATDPTNLYGINGTNLVMDYTER